MISDRSMHVEARETMKHAFLASSIEHFQNPPTGKTQARGLNMTALARMCSFFSPLDQGAPVAYLTSISAVHTVATAAYRLLLAQSCCLQHSEYLT